MFTQKAREIHRQQCTYTEVDLASREDGGCILERVCQNKQIFPRRCAAKAEPEVHLPPFVTVRGIRCVPCEFTASKYRKARSNKRSRSRR